MEGGNEEVIMQRNQLQTSIMNQLSNKCNSYEQTTNYLKKLKNYPTPYTNNVILIVDYHYSSMVNVQKILSNP